METYLLFFVASIVAGAINALAGGGGLIIFPLLMLVVAPVTADATTAVAWSLHIQQPFGAPAASWLGSLFIDGCGCFSFQASSAACWERCC
jgi:uncharacterized membrane protein YfcA